MVGRQRLELPRAAVRGAPRPCPARLPSAASICERINSEFAFVKDPRRNKLEHEKANKLVAIFHNRRLLARMNKPAYVEPAIGWTTEDNVAGVIKYGVADYEPRKSVAQIKAPTRPALPPPPNPQQDGPTLMLM